MAIKYELPKNWIEYDPAEIQSQLLNVKAAVLALTKIPYQRSWADELQQMQLKREVSGTSKIEGAEFTEKELDAALKETPAQLETRSQRQAAAAVATYRWLAELPPDKPMDESMIRDVHRRIITGCDDDHCPPGRFREKDQNVTFGTPRHRGVVGGDECAAAISRLVEAARSSFKSHDPLIQGLALHYHFAAMHPFLDGNGRTARALEALMLQRVGLRDTLFIAMSNYYYEEKTAYLQTLNETRKEGHNLTAFLTFALKGVEIQCNRLFAEIRLNVEKALFRNTVTDLFGRLKSPRKRVISERQVKLLNELLKEDEKSISQLYQNVQNVAGYYVLKNPVGAFFRDLNYLHGLGTIKINASARDTDIVTVIAIDLSWPTTITESEFFRRVKEMPKGKRLSFLSM